MSQNLEIVRAALDAYNRRDWDAAFENTAPDFEWDMSRAVGPRNGVYGLDQARQGIAEFVEHWESSSYQAEEFVEAGDQVVTPFTNFLRGRGGIEVRARGAFVWTIREGAIARICLYQERREALQAAGISE